MSDRPITTCPSLRWERADHRRGERGCWLRLYGRYGING